MPENFIQAMKQVGGDGHDGDVRGLLSLIQARLLGPLQLIVLEGW